MEKQKTEKQKTDKQKNRKNIFLHQKLNNYKIYCKSIFHVFQDSIVASQARFCKNVCHYNQRRDPFHRAASAGHVYQQTAGLGANCISRALLSGYFQVEDYCHRQHNLLLGEWRGCSCPAYRRGTIGVCHRRVARLNGVGRRQELLRLCVRSACNCTCARAYQSDNPGWTHGCQIYFVSMS